MNRFNQFQEEVNKTRENKTKKFQKIIKNLLKILQQEELEYLNEQRNVTSNKKHTDTLIEQLTTKTQETLEDKMNKQMQTFLFKPPINLVEEGKWLLGVSSFECTNSVFNITDENNSFSINISGHWVIEFDRKTFAKIGELKELRSFELHVEEVRKRGHKNKNR